MSPEAGARRVPRAWTRGPGFPCPELVVPDLVLAQAARRPDAVAVRQWDRRLTYGELAGAAASLAEELREPGVGPERRVGVCVRRRPAMVTAVLGVLLAGDAYVPLEPDGPAARLERVLEDSGAGLVVVDEETAALVEAAGHGTVAVPGPRAGPGRNPGLGGAADPGAGGAAGSVPACPARPDNAAYVLYTSGSTGQPKGVVVSHRSVVSYALAFGAFTGADEGTRAFGYASLGFDVSVLDLLVPLVAGGEVELVGEADRADPARLQRFVEEHRVNWGCVPVALLPLLDPDRLPAWRTVITGAEAPGPEQVERWAGPAAAPRRRFLNCYGPTEATVCVTAFETAGRWERAVPMGGPLANHRVQVVDDGLEPVPVGMPGELLIGGAGLARGYLGRPGHTAERFVPDPFGDEPGARLYRTGDRVVWEPGGVLRFLGRDDRQVKVHGQRVEIGEVEAAMRAHPLVAHAVVEAVDGAGGCELVGFYTSSGSPPEGAKPPEGPGSPQGSGWPGRPPSATELREHCASRLPTAMVPARFVALDRFPLTASGKVDGRALRALLVDEPATGAAEAPGGAGPASGAVGPRPAEPTGRPLEEVVAAAWTRLLGRASGRVGWDEDFFAAGGHSITAMRLVATLRAELRRNLAVEDVFAGRTLAGVVARVAEAPPLDGGDLPTGSPPALSPAQRRLWFVDKLDPTAAPYNIALAERLRGPLDVAALGAALAAVAERHEVLRWRVTDARGVPRVEVDPPVPAELPVTDLGGLPPAARDHELRQRLDAAARRRFDLATGPLWRAELLRLAPDDHVLALTFHHAAFDGWSQRPYFADLGRAYGAARAGAPATLPPPPAGFADYVAWRAERDRRRGQADLAWWLRHLDGAPAVLDLPRDAPRPPAQTYRGAGLHARVPLATTHAVRELAGRSGATAPAVLLAAFAELLRRLTGGGDLVVGTPAADRRHEAFHRLVGFFIEVVPLRLRLDPSRPFAELVRACAGELLEVLAHPSVPLDRIVGALDLPRDPSRPPLVQVLFNVYNFPEPRARLEGLAAERLAPGLPGSPFDLTVHVAERDGSFAVDLVHNADLYRPARMCGVLEAYLRLLDEACAAPEEPPARIALPGLPVGSPDEAAMPAPPAAGRPAPVPPEPSGRCAPGLDGPAPAAHAAPATGSERLVAAVWREVLGREAVGATDNFFDAGGDSMAAVVVQARLAELLGREVGIVELFRYPTVRSLAAHLDDGRSGAVRSREGPPADAEGSGEPVDGEGSRELRRAADRGAARRERARARAAGREGGGERHQEVGRQ